MWNRSCAVKRYVRHRSRGVLCDYAQASTPIHAIDATIWYVLCKRLACCCTSGPLCATTHSQTAANWPKAKASWQIAGPGCASLSLRWRLWQLQITIAPSRFGLPAGRLWPRGFLPRGLYDACPLCTVGPPTLAVTGRHPTTLNYCGQLTVGQAVIRRHQGN